MNTTVIYIRSGSQNSVLNALWSKMSFRQPFY